MNSINICRNIVRLQRKAGISKNVMAEFLGISCEMYDCLKSGIPVITLTEAERAANLFSLQLEDLAKENLPDHAFAEGFENIPAGQLIWLTRMLSILEYAGLRKKGKIILHQIGGL